MDVLFQLGLVAGVVGYAWCLVLIFREHTCGEWGPC